MWNFSDKLQSNFESTTTSSFQRNSKSTQNLPSQNAQVPNCISANRNSSLSNNLTAVSFPYTKQPASSFLQQSNILNSQKPSFSSSFACGEGLPVHCDFHRRGRSGNSNFSTSMISIMSSISNLPTYTQQHSETLILFEVFGVLYPGTLEITTEFQTRVVKFVIVDVPPMKRQRFQPEQPAFVQCIFHDNEDLLQEFIEGHIYRCVGHFSLHKDILKCLRIREATPSEIASLPTTIARMYQPQQRMLV